MRQLNGRDVDPALVFRADGAIPVFTLREKRAFSDGRFQLLYLVEASGLICLGNTEPGIRRAAESVLGGFVPSRQHRFADFQLQGPLSGSAGGYSLSSAFQRLSDSLRFRPGREDAESIVLEVMPKTAGIAQMWPLSVPASRRSRSFPICGSQQSTHAPST